MKSIRVLAFTTLLFTAGCDATEMVFCTTEARAGINVTVVDASSGIALASGSTLTLREGEWVETIVDAIGNALPGAWERAGTYDVTVARDGYQTWTRQGVTVTADECHVIPVTITASLEAVP